MAKHFRQIAILSLREFKRNFLIVIIFSFLMLFLIKRKYSNENEIQSIDDEEMPVILWWHAMADGTNQIKNCSNRFCRITTDRNYLTVAKAILFYGSDIDVFDLPLPRLSHHLWAILHEESPRNIQFMPYNSWLQHFNYTSTFSRHSDLPLSTYYLPSIDDLLSSKYVISVKAKSQSNLSSVLFMQSDCDTLTGREDYVKELMSFIKVDSYGSCLKNRKLPESLQQQQKDYLNNLYSPEVLQFLANYKFIISYENGVCSDYITEKFWRPLIVGSIPIYFGSPTINDWAPNKQQSFIDITKFQNPKQLADFLHWLDGNHTAYNLYLGHKFNKIQPITNHHLLRELRQRRTACSDQNLFQTFECGVCDHLHQKPGVRKTASELQYQCPHQPIYPPMSKQIKIHEIDWRSILSVGKCKANILHKLLERNRQFSQKEFDKLLDNEINLNKC